MPVPITVDEGRPAFWVTSVNVPSGIPGKAGSRCLAASRLNGSRSARRYRASRRYRNRRMRRRIPWFRRSGRPYAQGRRPRKPQTRSGRNVRETRQKGNTRRLTSRGRAHAARRHTLREQTRGESGKPSAAGETRWPHGEGSTTVSHWFDFTFCNCCTPPAGHRNSINWAESSAPSPITRRRSLAER